VVLNTTTITVGFAGVPGTTYVLEYKDNLGDPTWKTGGSFTGHATTGAFQATITETGDHVLGWTGNMFFRAHFNNTP
jgi:hypothetical protein